MSLSRPDESLEIETKRLRASVVCPPNKFKEDIGMSKKKLQALGVKELRAKAKELNISGRWEMTKAELIEAIFESVSAKSGNETSSAKDEGKIETNQDNVEATNKGENEAADVVIDMKQKMPYIENAEIGALVAFRLPSGKVKSAKIINKSSKRRKLKVETEYGAVYVVSYDDVIWVRTGARWPRGVYKLLKGMVNNDGKKEQRAEAK